jgi:hypothetical protein
MQGAFGTVVWIVAAVGVVGAIAALLMGRRTWDEYGKRHLVLDSERSHSAPTGSAATLERDTEIRQLLEARNARRRRRGEPELDIDAELNARRVRRGEPALDVEAEIEREIAGLTGI